MSKTWWSIHYNLDENGTFVEFALQWKDLTKWAEAMSYTLVYQQVHVTKPVPKPCDALSLYPKWESHHIILDEGAVTPFKELFYDMSIYMYLKYSINQFHWLKVYFAESLVTGETLICEKQPTGKSWNNSNVLPGVEFLSSCEFLVSN